MSALVAWESLRSYNNDSCVAPFTTRWMLLDERVPNSSCRLSQLGSDSPAVTTASGLFPRLPGLPSLLGPRPKAGLPQRYHGSQGGRGRGGVGNPRDPRGGFRCSVAKVLALFAPDPREKRADRAGAAPKKWAALEAMCADAAVPLLPPDALRQDGEVRRYAFERDLAL